MDLWWCKDRIEGETSVKVELGYKCFNLSDHFIYLWHVLSFNFGWVVRNKQVQMSRGAPEQVVVQ